MAKTDAEKRADQMAELSRLAAEVDVRQVAQSILANPVRAMVSLAAMVALAQTIELTGAIEEGRSRLEALREIAGEAEQLVAALEGAMPWDRTAEAEHIEHVAGTMATLKHWLAALRATLTTEEE